MFEPRFGLWDEQAQADENAYVLVYEIVEPRFELRFKFGLRSSKVLKSNTFYRLGRLSLGLSFGMSRLKMMKRNTLYSTVLPSAAGTGTE